MNPLLDRLRQSIAGAFLGNAQAVDQLIACLLARGHALIEDVPGVGKTVLATAIARSIDCSFSRIQLTPDLLPSDILGVSIFSRSAGGGPAGSNGSGTFEFKRGPIFANIILADEINRTPPRTQTALLEAMAEATVTVDGKTYPLDQPFLLIATQNPFDFEGTYLLPENQLDRFLMRITLGYLSPADEARVIATRPADGALQRIAPVLHASDVLALQRQVDEVQLDPALIDYIVAIAAATRQHPDLRVGLSPRGALALAQAARATATLDGRTYVIPEDILGNLLPVVAHRVIPRSLRGAVSPSRLAIINGPGSSREQRSLFPPDSSQGILLSIVDSVASPV
jgi:MoxR-like ATPase